VIPSTNHAEERYGVANPFGINEPSETIIPVADVPRVHPLVLISSIKADSVGEVPHTEQDHGAGLEGGEDKTLDATPSYVYPRFWMAFMKSKASVV